MPARGAAAGQGGAHLSPLPAPPALLEMSSVRWEPLCAKFIPQHLLQWWSHTDGWKYSTAARVVERCVIKHFSFLSIFLNLVAG